VIPSTKALCLFFQYLAEALSVIWLSEPQELLDRTLINSLNQKTKSNHLYISVHGWIGCPLPHSKVGYCQSGRWNLKNIL
jgi:hypothetical protein